MDRIKKTSLTALLTGAMMASGCNVVPTRGTLTEANKYEGTSAEYFHTVNAREMRLDAAETNREARCIREFMGVAKYDSKREALEALSTCVRDKRVADKYAYLLGAMLLDGVKVYGFLNGLDETKDAVTNGGGNGGNGGTLPTITPGTTSGYGGNLIQ